MWEKIGEQPRRTEYFTTLSILRKRQTKEEKKEFTSVYMATTENTTNKRIPLRSQ